MNASAPPPQAEPPARLADKAPRLGRRASLIGTVIALIVMAGLGALAWYLTQPGRNAPTTATGAGPGGPGGGGSGGSSRSAPATTVGVAPAEASSIPVTIDALGTVTPQATVRVRPQVSGVLQKVLFKEGQLVKAGDVLAQIDPRQFELALMQAVGQRQRDEAQIESARVQLKRFQTLLGQDSIARQEVDTQTALVKQLEGTITLNKAAEGTARLNLSYTRVLAPISGRVGLRTVDVGNVVSSNDANGIALITQVMPIDVLFSVPQDRAGELQQLAAAGNNSARAMQVTALDRTRSSALATGVFSSLDNQVDTQTGTVRAKARFDNQDLALFPSQFVNVQLIVRTLDNVITVPVSAVRFGNAGDYVYVLNAQEKTVSLRPVKRGIATATKVVITAGLQAGERVITEGADRLSDGARVALPGAGAPPRGPGEAAGRDGKRSLPVASAAEAPGAAASQPQRRASRDSP